MSTSTEQSQEAIKPAKLMAPVEDMIAALEALAPDPDTLRAIRFGQLFPIIVRKKGENCSDQQILSCLAELGLPLHAKTYAKLFAAELQVRNDRGERVRCPQCDQPLQGKERHAANEVANSLATDTPVLRGEA